MMLSRIGAVALCVFMPNTRLGQDTVAADLTLSHSSLTSEGPTILFDEGHFNYHTTTTRYDALVTMLASEGFRIVVNTEKFTRETLSGYDILAIVNAQPASEWTEENAFDAGFSSSEVAAVASWVEAGGALLLVADHAPWGAAAAPMAAAFGVEMKSGITGDTVHSRNTHGTNPPGAWIEFSRTNGLLGEHPILDGRDSSEQINQLAQGGGQSLGLPRGSYSLLSLAPSAFDWVFTRETPFEPITQSAAGRVRALALELGRGRVVVLGEAGLFTSQSLATGQDDSRQFALNIFRWLGRAL